MVHLSEYNTSILDKKKIAPGDILGKVGTSGLEDENRNIDGKYDAHLHISFKIVSKDTILKEIINGKEGKKLVIGEHYKKLSVCNPFHNESKKSPNKKGILYEN